MARPELQKFTLHIQKENKEKDLSIQVVTEWPNESIERADEEVIKAARAIRLYYYRQIPLLRQIPYLMLESYKQGGTKGVEQSRAFTDCLMPIHLNKEWYGYYDLFLELRTGTIVKAEQLESLSLPGREKPMFNTISKGWNVATDREVYKKLAYQDEKLRFVPEKNVSKLIEELGNPLDGGFVNNGDTNGKNYKERIDFMMNELPKKVVVDLLRKQGFDL